MIVSPHGSNGDRDPLWEGYRTVLHNVIISIRPYTPRIRLPPVPKMQQRLNSLGLKGGFAQHRSLTSSAGVPPSARQSRYSKFVVRSASDDDDVRAYDGLPGSTGGFVPSSTTSSTTGCLVPVLDGRTRSPSPLLSLYSSAGREPRHHRLRAGGVHGGHLRVSCLALAKGLLWLQ
jgi:hypothetical protein